MKSARCKAKKELYAYLKEKCLWLRKETLKLHKVAPETRLASALSAIEIFVTLYYGRVLNFDPDNPRWEKRDRFIISKGHGAISLYPILADTGYFDRSELLRVCKSGSFLGSIPDPVIPGFETANGSLGHGLGVGCGVSLALRMKNIKTKVFVLLGDGELNEGAVWEAVMFAGFHKMENLIAIVDYNKICMLDYCKKILDLEPLRIKFEAFKWDTKVIDGHDTEALYKLLLDSKNKKNKRPKAIIAHTVKGKGVPSLERDHLCHIRSLGACDVDRTIASLR